MLVFIFTVRLVAGAENAVYCYTYKAFSVPRTTISVKINTNTKISDVTGADLCVTLGIRVPLILGNGRACKVRGKLH